MQRDAVKQMCYGIIYGMNPHAAAARLGKLGAVGIGTGGGKMGSKMGVGGAGRGSGRGGGGNAGDFKFVEAGEAGEAGEGAEAGEGGGGGEGSIKNRPVSSFLDRFPDAAKYIETKRKACAECGWVYTLGGRRRRLATIMSGDPAWKDAAGTCCPLAACAYYNEMQLA
jgi:hypothetical protein